MLWNRAKTILIAVFFLINLFLINFMFQDRYHDNSQAISDLTAVLSKNEVHLQVNDLPRVDRQLKVPELASVPIDDTLAKKLIATPVATENGYQNSEKTCYLESRNGEFFFRDEAPLQSSFFDVTQDNVVVKLNPYLNLLGVGEYAYAANIIGIGEDIVVEYAYRIGDYKLFDSRFSVTVTKSGIKQIKGFLGVPNQDNGFTYTLSNLETVLLSLAQNNLKGLEITDIDLGYYLINYQDAMVSQAIPVYRLRTSWGEYILDARDGVEYTQRVLSGDLREVSNEEVFTD